MATTSKKEDIVLETPEIPSNAVSCSDEKDLDDGEREEMTTTLTNASSTARRKRERVLAGLQVLGGFFLMMNTWGVANTFGAFQTYYEAHILSSKTDSNISWIGCLQAFLLLLIGGASGPIFDMGYLRSMVAFGSFFAVLGMMMTSLCTQYWHFMMAQAVTVGLGAGFLLLPSLAVMPQYFTTRRAFATGIAASGSSIGGVIYPSIFHRLIDSLGFGWTVRVIAFIMLGTLLIPVTFMRAKTFPQTRRPFFDVAVLRHSTFTLFSVGQFFGFAGMYIPFYYVGTYAIAKGITDVNLAFYLLAVMNASSTFGRILPNFFADKVGVLNVAVPFTAMTSVLGYCWLAVDSKAGVIVFCLFYGFFSGSYVSMQAPAIATISPDMSLVGTHMGMSFEASAFGLLMGTPVAGQLLTDMDWTGPAIWCGTMNAIATICIFAARMEKSRWAVWVKA